MPRVSEEHSHAMPGGEYSRQEKGFPSQTVGMHLVEKTQLKAENWN